jgi:hypothetical protein
MSEGGRAMDRGSTRDRGRAFQQSINLDHYFAKGDKEAVRGNGNPARKYNLLTEKVELQWLRASLLDTLLSFLMNFKIFYRLIY